MPASPVVATIVDLSSSGCGGRAEGPLQKGATILLALFPDEEVAGQVVWREGEEFGVEFTEKIDEELIARFRANAPFGDRSASDLRDKFGRPLPPLAGEAKIRPL